MSINQVFLVGRITADPELKTSQAGVNYVQFTLAVDRPKTANNQNPGTDFIPVVVFNGQAKNLAQYVKKGRQLAIVGNLRVDQITYQDGTKKTSIRVFAERIEFLGNPNGNQAQPQEQQAKSKQGVRQLPQAQPSRSTQQQAKPQQTQPAQQPQIQGVVEEIELPDDFNFDLLDENLPF
ncbi:single-stranded DNA-binding protein [Carboxydothermus ferrireducens]|uniref:Single-stranded DNA-binding protein n=1 Tax=Carboxydothermus ferrireducens DSM 11255 TaxID=1119529 RepID=A0ABX2R7Q4_9THEO|nr:single-stranded DNA-binding protein [Carboxydothermus ferrireducens]NYE57194.1 single-strand DNA-binding protein [Carboxydothermus ferrireducens DSM 11255]